MSVKSVQTKGLTVLLTEEGGREGAEQGRAWVDKLGWWDLLGGPGLGQR